MANGYLSKHRAKRNGRRVDAHENLDEARRDESTERRNKCKVKEAMSDKPRKNSLRSLKNFFFIYVGVIVASFDLLVTPIVSCTRIYTDGVSGHDPNRIGWFRSVYEKREAFSHFPIGLKWGGHENDPPLGQCTPGQKF